MTTPRTHGIAWTDETWNPTRGCSRVSEGCRNCYAETRASQRFSGPGMPYEGLTTKGTWNGVIYVAEHKFTEPLSWRLPLKIFVDSMSDLFHEHLTDETIDRIFDVMARASWHTFQILTKRPERMHAYVAARPPLPNVWLGVSVEDQATADARIPLLLETPAAVRFISAEPLLAPITLTRFLESTPALSWVIVGGESAQKSKVRPCDVQWVRAVVQQCQDAAVPVFVKQLGTSPCDGGTALRLRDRKGDDLAEFPEDLRVQQFPAGHTRTHDDERDRRVAALEPLTIHP